MEDQVAFFAALLSFTTIGASLAGVFWVAGHRAGGLMTAADVAETTLIFGSLAALTGVGLAWLAVRRSAAALRRLTATVRRIGRDPMATMVPDVGGPRDLANLSFALRALLRRTGFADQEWSLDDTAPGDLQRAFAVFQAKPDSDPLTGLLDRRAFLILADDSVPYFNRYRRGVAVLVVNIDQFKDFNHQHGRDLGDTMLRNIADVLSLSVRSTDKVSRFGGDEFVVLLREIGVSDSLALAERMRRAVQETRVQGPAGSLNLTVSIGVAVVSDDDVDLQSMIERADEALLAVKKSGRNRVEYRSASTIEVSRACRRNAMSIGWFEGGIAT